MTATHWPRCTCGVPASTALSDEACAPYCPTCMLMWVPVPTTVEDAIRASERAVVVRMITSKVEDVVETVNLKRAG